MSIELRPLSQGSSSTVRLVPGPAGRSVMTAVGLGQLLYLPHLAPCVVGRDVGRWDCD
ncbi:MAG: hypothetical protein WB471_01970 [Nocardioides sp.]